MKRMIVVFAAFVVVMSAFASSFSSSSSSWVSSTSVTIGSNSSVLYTGSLQYYGVSNSRQYSGSYYGYTSQKGGQSYEYGEESYGYSSSGISRLISSGYDGVITPGEKVSIVIPEIVGYTAKGLPSGLKLNKKTGEISGAAKKPTAADGVIVTFTKKGAEKLTTKFIVGPIPTINVTLDGDTEKCKVTGGNKPYLVGAKVNLQAKAPKGTAFVGWFKDGTPWPSENEYLSPKLKYVMTADSLDLVSRFEKEVIDIDFTELASAAFQVGTAVAEGDVVIGASAKSGIKSITASKLPSGLKLKQNKKLGIWYIYGTPKKAGNFTSTIKVTSKSGAIETLPVSIIVGNGNILPDWATGTFTGKGKNWCTDCYDGEDECGPWYLDMSITISASGAVSGRLMDSNSSDYGVLKNGRVLSVSAQLVVLTAELWWYEDGKLYTKSTSEIALTPDGTLEYFDDDDPSSDEHCPIKATLSRK